MPFLPPLGISLVLSMAAIAAAQSNSRSESSQAPVLESARSESVLISSGASPILGRAPAIGILNSPVRSAPGSRQAGGGAWLGAANGALDCYTTDDGVCDSAQGWKNGANLLWMKGFEAIGGSDTIVEISTLFGFPGGNLAPNRPTRLAIWDDPTNDYDPADAVLLWETTTTSANENTFLFTSYTVPGIAVNGVFFVGVAVAQPAQDFAAPVDRDSENFGRCWHVANFSGPLNFNNIPSNAQVFIPGGNWMLRAEGLNSCGGPAPACYGVDDTTCENGAALINGGESAWLMGFEAAAGGDTVTEISTKYGFPGGNLGTGLPGRLAIWDDPTNDYDPADAVLLWETNTVSANENTDIFNSTVVPNVGVSGVFFVGASLVGAPGEIPAPLDTSPPYFPGRAWFVGNEAGALDMTNLVANSTGPIGFSARGDFAIRANTCSGVANDCYIRDDSSSETAFGLTNGGESAWIMGFEAVGGSDTITEISTAYGTPGGPPMTPGLPGRLAIWDDPTNDFDPSDAVLLWDTAVIGAYENTNFLNPTAVPNIEVNGVFFIGASLDDIPGEFPIPVDETLPRLSGRSFLVWSNLGPGTLDINNLANNNGLFGFGAVGDFLLRATGVACDCNGNGVLDADDIASGTSVDCNSDGVPDECQEDCNGNGVLDSCDLAAGTSQDCNSNGIPDECDTDCNGNGIPDDCETFTDCNANGIPDECELAGNDCNGNGVPDECDTDCNANGIPDDCETFTDCNSNGIPDECELTGNDCNADGIPDDCQLAGNDQNGNGILDDCEVGTDGTSSGGPPRFHAVLYPGSSGFQGLRSAGGSPGGSVVFVGSRVPVGAGASNLAGSFVLGSAVADRSGGASLTVPRDLLGGEWPLFVRAFDVETMTCLSIEPQGSTRPNAGNAPALEEAGSGDSSLR